MATIKSYPNRNAEKASQTKQVIMSLLVARKRAGDDTPVRGEDIRELVKRSYHHVGKCFAELAKEGKVEAVNQYYWKLKE